MNRLHSIQLLGFRDNLHVAHWQASRKTNEHKTLGDLYESILGKVDALTELAIARDGDVEFPAVQIGITNRAAYPELLQSGLALVAEIRDTFKTGADDDALNIISDIAADIRRAAYKLEVVLP
jgi:hypothetical protein